MTPSIPDHDELAALAKENPEQLEELRHRWVNELIESAPEDTRKRLRGLQFQIDCQRKLHTNPLGACVEISRMMSESLGRLNALMNGSQDDIQAANQGSATVLAFPSAS